MEVGDEASKGIIKQLLPAFDPQSKAWSPVTQINPYYHRYVTLRYERRRIYADGH